jgi:hypothetical protein
MNFLKKTKNIMKTIKILGVLLAMVVGTLAVSAQTKTYNNHGVSMTYPSYLVLDEEDYSDGELNLEFSDVDEISGMFVLVSSNEEILTAIEFIGLETVFNMLQGEMMSEFVGAELGDIEKTDSSVIMPFTVSEDGVVANGEMALGVQGNKIILTVILGHGSEKFSALKQAVKTLKVS